LSVLTLTRGASLNGCGDSEMIINLTAVCAVYLFELSRKTTRLNPLNVILKN